LSSETKTVDERPKNVDITPTTCPLRAAGNARTFAVSVVT
jgi:hypothetical protein